MTTSRSPRRTRDDLRELLLASALVEFAERGFEGASTRSIAERVDAHQPQINYHFESKDALWTAAVDHLFGLLITSLAEVPPVDPAGTVEELATWYAASIRQFVRFAASHPELNRIMVHEATSNSQRLDWMVETHVRPIYEGVTSVWKQLVDAGVAAPIHPAAIHYVAVGASSLLFVNAPEARLLAGIEPTDPEFVEIHADGIVAMLLPGLAAP